MFTYLVHKSFCSPEANNSLYAGRAFTMLYSFLYIHNVIALPVPPPGRNSIFMNPWSSSPKSISEIPGNPNNWESMPRKPGFFEFFEYSRFFGYSGGRVWVLQIFQVLWVLRVFLFWVLMAFQVLQVFRDSFLGFAESREGDDQRSIYV